MSTTYTFNAGLAKPARADRNWDVQLNANLDTLDASAAVGSLATTTTESPSASLNVKIAQGQFRKSDGTIVSFAGTISQSVPASATTCFWLTDVGVLATGPAFPTGVNLVKLATVVSGASSITSISDARSPWVSAGAVAPNGTVTSVGLSLPTDWTVSNSPVTTNGVLTATRTNQNANSVFAGPASGGPGQPVYRGLVGADLPVFGASGVTHTPGGVPDPGATAGTTRYLREDGTWVAPTGGSGTVTSVSLTMPAGLTVSGSPITTSGALAVSGTLAASAGGTGVNAGTAASGSLLIGNGTGFSLATLTPGTGISISNASGAITIAASGSGGSVSSVGLTLPSELAVSGSPITSSGTLAVSWASQSFVGNQFLATPTGGGGITRRSIVPADLPIFVGSGAAHAAGIVPDPGAMAGTTRYLREDGTWSAPTTGSGGSGTVTSVGLTMPAGLSVTGSPLTTSGTLNVSGVLSPSAGGTGVSAGSATPGSLFIGTGTGFSLATLTAGSGISIANSPGTITISASGSGSSSMGTVSSVGLSMPSELAVSGSPVTSSGTLGVSWASASFTANQFLATPNGMFGGITRRSIVPADLPVFVASGASHAAGIVPDPGATAGTTRYLREDGTWSAPATGSGGGTVSSVGLSLPSELAVSGSPVTSSGTLGVSWASASFTANQFLATPNGTFGGITRRSIAPADLPVFVASGAAHAAGIVPDPGATAGSTRFLREDGSWIVPSGTGGSSTTQTLALTAPSSYPYTCISTDSCILVDTSAARTITLPKASVAGTGRVYQIKDTVGAAYSNPITVNVVSGGGSIDGAASLTINNNYGEAQYVSDGTNWKRLYNRADMVEGNLTVTKKLLITGNLNLSVCTFNTSSFSLNPNYSVNLVNYTGSGAVAATLPQAATVGANLFLIVKDIAGTAGSRSILISPFSGDTLDGSNFYVPISTNYGVLRLLCDGISAWYTV